MVNENQTTSGVNPVPGAWDSANNANRQFQGQATGRPMAQPKMGFLGARKTRAIKTVFQGSQAAGRYWWRQPRSEKGQVISNDSPVTVDEFVRAVGVFLPNKGRENALRQMLNSQMSGQAYSYRETTNPKQSQPDLWNADDQTGFVAREEPVNVLETVDPNTGLYYHMSPDQMQTVVDMLTVAHNNGLDFDLRMGDRGNLEMVVNDNGHAHVDLLDLVSPEQTGQVRTQSGATSRLAMNQVLFRTERELDPNTGVQVDDYGAPVDANGRPATRPKQHALATVYRRSADGQTRVDLFRSSSSNDLSSNLIYDPVTTLSKRDYETGLRNSRNARLNENRRTGGHFRYSSYDIKNLSANGALNGRRRNEEAKGNDLIVDNDNSYYKSLSNYMGLDQDVKSLLAIAPMVHALGLDPTVSGMDDRLNHMKVHELVASRGIQKGEYRDTLDLGDDVVTHIANVNLEGDVDDNNLPMDENRVKVRGFSHLGRDAQGHQQAQDEDLHMDLSNAIATTESPFTKYQSLLNPDTEDEATARHELGVAYKQARTNYLKMLIGPDESQSHGEWAQEQLWYRQMVSGLQDSDADGIDTGEEMSVLTHFRKALNRAEVTNSGRLDDSAMLDERRQLEDTYADDTDKQARVLMMFDNLRHHMNEYLGGYESSLTDLDVDDSQSHDDKGMIKPEYGMNLSQVIALTQDTGSSLQYPFVMARRAKFAGLTDRVFGNNEYNMNQIIDRTLGFDEKTGQTLNDLQAQLDDSNGLDQRLQKYIQQVRTQEGQTGKLIAIEDAPEEFKNFLWQGPVNVRVKNPDGTNGVETVMHTQLINPQGPTRFKINVLKRVKAQMEARGMQVDDAQLQIDDHGVIHFQGRVPVVDPLTHEVSTAQNDVLREENVFGDEAGASQKTGMVYQYKGVKNYKSAIDGQHRNAKTHNAEFKLYKDALANPNDPANAQLIADYRDKYAQYRYVKGDIGQVFAPDYDGLVRTRFNTFPGIENHDFTFLPGIHGIYQMWKTNPDGSIDMDALRQELSNGMGPNNRFVAETYQMYVNRELSQALNEVLTTNNVGDITKPNSTTIMNKIVHGEAVGSRMPEGISRMPASALKGAKIVSYLNRVRIDDIADSSTNTTSEVDYMEARKAFVNRWMDNHNQQVPDEATIIANLRNRMNIYGDGSVGVINKPENAGIFDPGATGQGKTQGLVRFLTAMTKVDPNTGKITPAFMHYDSGQILRDENGNPRRIPALSAIGYCDFLNNQYNAPFDRSFIANEQLLKSQWTDSNVNLAVTNLQMLNMEDGSVVSKAFAESHRSPYNPPRYDENGKELLRPILEGDKLSDGSGNKTTVAKVIDPDMSLDQARAMGIENVVLLFRQYPELQMAINGTSNNSRHNMTNTKEFIESHKDEHGQAPTMKVHTIKYDENGQPVPKRDENGNIVYRTREDGTRVLSRTAVAPDSMTDEALIQRASNSKYRGPKLFNGTPKNPQYEPEYETEEQAVDTGATINKAHIIGTDQLVDRKVSTYDDPGSAQDGRMYSILVMNVDSQRGLNGVSSYMHRATGADLNTFRELRSYLLATGIDLQSDGFHNLSTKRMSELAAQMQRSQQGNAQNPTAPVNVQFVPSEDGMDIAMSSAKVGGKDLITDGQFKSRRNNRTYKFGDFAQDPNDSKKLRLSQDNEQFLSALVSDTSRGTNNHIASNAETTDAYHYNPTTDFFNQLPDGGFLKLPDGMRITLRGMRPETTDAMYILPKKMRNLTQMLDGTTRVNEYVTDYQRLGIKLTRYIQLRQMVQDAGLAHTPEQQQLIDDYLTKALGVQGVVDSLQSKIISNELGANKGDVKHTFLRQSIMGHPMPQSATSQMGNNAHLPIDVVEVSPKIAKQLGLEADPNSPYGDAHYKGHPEWKYVHFHRDPVWRPYGSLAMKVRINPNIKAIKVNPLMVSLADGDFDGDNAGLIGMPDAAAQKDLEQMLPSRMMLDQTSAKMGLQAGVAKPSSLLDISAEFVDQAAQVNPRLKATIIDAKGQQKITEGRLHDPAFREAVMRSAATEFPQLGIDTKPEAMAAVNDKKFLQTYMAVEIARFYKRNEPDAAGQFVNDVQTRIQNLNGKYGNSPLMHSGVDYNSRETAFARYREYAASGAKGKLDANGKLKGEGEMQQYMDNLSTSERMDLLNQIQKQATAKNATLALDAYQQAVEAIRGPQSQVENATKTKSSLTGVPGSLQQRLTAVFRQFGNQGVMVASTIGYAGTQSNLQVKHEADKARVQSEYLKDVIGGLVSGKWPDKKPVYAFVGPEGTSTDMLDTPGMLSDMKDRKGNSLISPDDAQLGSMLLGDSDGKVADRLAVIDHRFRTVDAVKLADAASLKQFAKDGLGMDTTKWSGDDVTRFKNTIIHAKTPYLPQNNAADYSEHGVPVDAFTKAMTRIYTQDLGLDVDPEIFRMAGDYMANPSINPQTGYTFAEERKAAQMGEELPQLSPEKVEAKRRDLEKNLVISQDGLDDMAKSPLDEINMNGYNAIEGYAVHDSEDGRPGRESTPLLTKEQEAAILGPDQSMADALDFSKEAKSDAHKDVDWYADEANAQKVKEVHEAVRREIDQDERDAQASKDQTAGTKNSDTASVDQDKREDFSMSDQERALQEARDHWSVSSTDTTFAAKNYDSTNPYEQKETYRSVYEYILVQEARAMHNKTLEQEVRQAKDTSELVKVSKKYHVKESTAITNEQRAAMMYQGLAWKSTAVPTMGAEARNLTADDVNYHDPLMKNVFNQAKAAATNNYNAQQAAANDSSRNNNNNNSGKGAGPDKGGHDDELSA